MEKIINIKDRKFLITMIMLIFVSRFFISLVVMQTRNGELSQDEGLYSEKALMLSFQMKGERNIIKYFADYFINDYDTMHKDYGLNLYTRMLGWFYYLFGYQIQTARLINAAIFAIAFLFVFYTAKTVFDPKIARTASAIFAFFPSMLLWSSMICGDVVIIACVTAFIFFMIHFLKSKKWVSYFVLMLLFLFLARLAGSYVANLLMVFAIAGVFYKIFFLMHKKIRIAVLSFIAGAMILACLNNGAVDFIKAKYDRMAYAMIKSQEGRAVADDSSYAIYPSGCYVDRRCTLPELAGAYTKGMGYALFSPFPWRIDSKLQLAAYPQMILWYIMLPFALYGIYLGYRSRRMETVVIFLYCFCAMSILALAEGNVGSMFRHRDIVTPFLLIYFAAGFEWIRQKYFT